MEKKIQDYELLMDIIEQQEKILVLQCMGSIKKDGDVYMHPQINYNDCWTISGKMLMPDKDFAESMLEDNWHEILSDKKVKEGNYFISILYHICSDSDDGGHHWTYYEFGAIELEWICSFEQEEQGRLMSEMELPDWLMPKQ